MTTKICLPKWKEVLHECIRAELLIQNFNFECACSVVFHQLPDLVNNHSQLRGKDRVEIDLLIDYLINFVYIPILATNDFTQPHQILISKD